MEMMDKFAKQVLSVWYCVPCTCTVFTDAALHPVLQNWPLQL